MLDLDEDHNICSYGDKMNYFFILYELALPAVCQTQKFNALNSTVQVNNKLANKVTTSLQILLQVRIS